MAQDELLAIVTMNKEAVGGDIPMFFATTEEELAKVATTVAKVLKAMVHEAGDGVYMIVRH